MVEAQEIETWIRENWQGGEATVQVKGDGYHFEAKVVSEDFAGKNRLARHRLVYATLGDKMAEIIHALSIKAVTPEEDTKTI